MAVAEVPTDVSNAELIRWAFDRLNDQDVDSVKRIWSAETVERFPDRTCRGADEIAEYFKESFAAVSDFRIEPAAITEQGDDVFVRWHLTGRHRGPFFGIEPTGKQVAIDGIDHFVVKDGIVESNFVVFDRMQFAQQLGLMAPDGSTADRALKGAFNVRTKLLSKLRG